MSNITLRIRDLDYTDWLSSRVDMDVRTLAWSFSASVTTPVEQPQQLAIEKGDLVEVRYQERIVLTGYIDTVGASHDDQNVRYELSGRSLTGQLTDSSAVYEGGQFDNQRLSDIARTLCRPFGIDVVQLAPGHDAPFTTVRIEQGETVFELLERLARQRGVLLTSNSQGALVVTRAGTALVTPELRLGENIKAASGTDSLQQRASQYIVKGSTNGGLSWDADQASGNAIVVYDRSVPLYRPRIVVCESELSAENARARGQWQRCRDLGEDVIENTTVTGWDNSEGYWQPNRLVYVDNPLLGINGERLIVAVTLTEGDDGELCELTTQPPEALVITEEQASEEALAWQTNSTQ
ncbi:phage baseplate assembly protein [Agarivorans sp. B2Z047]|uniref:phage baseplate assembly protein n=2 Tax=Agarivorans sp. B2Z047 TaxID=2652721 RepID=UPI002019319A|nr:contractile injection system protein, VgrG/Pvc8 family [Agarivorans sp. B2Z047]UQN43746.1 hypothetical protein LQZ07_04555 [Agarivorans sp. B2Z047]